MRTRNVRDTTIALPSDDAHDLAPIDHVPRPGDRVTDHRLTGDHWARATLTDTVISHSWLTGADLSASTFTRVTLDRCVLSGCTLMGADWNTVTLRDVVLEECRLDYSTLTTITTTGPVAFLRCNLTETTIADSTLTTSVFDQCRLSRLEFARCNLRGADLRGNDLHELATITGLRGVRLDQSQLPALAAALVRELAITVATAG